MTLKEAKALLAYHRWATEKMFHEAQKLSKAEYFESTETGHLSIHNYILHIVVVQHYWLCRWIGEDPFLRLDHIQSLEDLLAFWNQVEEQTRKYLNDVHADAAKQIFHEADPDGQFFSHSWSETILQVVLHSSTLRGQIIASMRKLNKEVSPVDFISYSRFIRSNKRDTRRLNPDG